MEFTLFYQGELLKTKKVTVEEKQRLRRHFHSQLKVLWQRPPLLTNHSDGNRWEQPFWLVKEIGNFRFVPLIIRTMHMVAEIDIMMLRPEPPGDLIKSGDIDNRLKTLFDALKIPNQPSAIPRGQQPEDGEDPFFCMLEDDSLITKVSVNTAQLLKGTNHPSEVVLLIHVQTKLAKATMDNLDLI
jgi:hypothetical protein